eukprot:g42568.t1
MESEGRQSQNRVTAIFKNSKECIDQKVYQAEIGNIPAAFVDGSVNGGDRNGANSLVIKEKFDAGHMEIQASYIGTTLLVRQVGQHLGFAILMPEEVASSHTEEQDQQLCVSGCPFTERLPLNSPTDTEEGAKAKCKEKLQVEDIYFECCVFDILMTGDPNVSLAAFKAVEDAKILHPDKETFHVHQKRLQQKQPCQPCKVLLTNVKGLVPKLGELSNRLIKQQPDIVLLTEPYLTDNVPNTTIIIPGYVLSQRQDGPSRGGGMVVYSWEEVALGALSIDSRPHEVSWLRVKQGQENLLLITTYRPSSANEL